MLSEQECIEVTEKMWGFQRHNADRWWDAAIVKPHILLSALLICRAVNSYEGMGRTLEAMRAKGWDFHIESDNYGAVPYWFVWVFKFPQTYRDVVDRDAPCLPDAVNGAALAALNA